MGLVVLLTGGFIAEFLGPDADGPNPSLDPMYNSSDGPWYNCVCGTLDLNQEQSTGWISSAHGMDLGLRRMGSA